MSIPCDVYIPTEQLTQWFINNTKVPLMDKMLWKYLNTTKLGFSLPCRTRPEVRTIPLHIDSVHKERLRHTALIVDRGGDDFSWEGLEHLLSTPIDKELSLIIWNFLITYLDEKRNVLRGYYRWQSSANNHEKEFDSKTCVLLKQTAWLYHHDGDAYKPTELKPGTLMEGYGYVKRGVKFCSFF